MLKKIRRFFYIAYALIVFVLILLIPLLNSIFRQNNKYQIFKWYAWCSSTWYKCVGIKLENIYISKNIAHHISPCIYVSNHVSYLDIPTMLSSVKHPIYFIAKAELRKKFIIGFLTKKISIFVKRENLKDRTKTFLKLKAHLEKGNSICIFPEGKINDSNQVLLPFQRGSFAVAIQTQTPIQPIVLLDTEKRLPITSLLSLTKGKNRVVYLPTIDTSQYQESELEKLLFNVHQKMEEVLLEYKKRDVEI